MNSIFSKNSFCNRGQGLIGIIIVLIMVALLGGGLYYYFSKQTLKAPEEPIIDSEPIVEVVAETTIMDCLALAEVDPEKSALCTQDLTEIFADNLLECKPSIGTTFIGWEPILLGMFREYEIKGIENNFCVVRFGVRFLDQETLEIMSSEEIKEMFIEEEIMEREKAQTVAQLLSQEMICQYGPDERIIDPYVAQIKGCSGPLYEGLELFGELLGFSTESETSKVSEPEGLLLSVISPKENYGIEEPIEVEYYIKYDDTSFQGLLLYCLSAEGEVLETCRIEPGTTWQRRCGMIRGTFWDVDFAVPGKDRYLKTALYAFQCGKTGTWYSYPTDSFNQAGLYTYSVSVFNCQEVENILGKPDCGRNIKTEDLDIVPVIGSASKTIMVNE